MTAEKRELLAFGEEMWIQVQVQRKLRHNLNVGLNLGSGFSLTLNLGLNQNLDLNLSEFHLANGGDLILLLFFNSFGLQIEGQTSFAGLFSKTQYAK